MDHLSYDDGHVLTSVMNVFPFSFLLFLIGNIEINHSNKMEPIMKAILVTSVIVWFCSYPSGFFHLVGAVW